MAEDVYFLDIHESTVRYAAVRFYYTTCYLSLVMRKPAFCICENKAVTTKSRFSHNEAQIACSIIEPDCSISDCRVQINECLRNTHLKPF